MTTFIKGITLRFKNGKPFLTKLLSTSCVDSYQLKVGSIITTNAKVQYKVIEILYIDLNSQDIELVVEEII